MIRVTSFGPVLRIDLARRIFGQGRYWTTAYWIDGLLIDTGCAYTAKELVISLVEQDVKKVVNTHSHEDHIGANAAIRRQFPGIKIYAHPLSLPILTDPHLLQPLHPYRRFFWGWPEPAVVQSLVDGEMILTDKYKFTVIYTPGHTPDHICLYEPDQGWLFSGDLFIGGRDRALGAGNNIWQIIASLKRISLLHIEWLFPGCARARANPNQELKAKIEYLEQMAIRIQELYHKGWSIGKITRSVCGSPMLIELLTFGHFSRYNLVSSFLKCPIF